MDQAWGGGSGVNPGQPALRSEALTCITQPSPACSRPLDPSGRPAWPARRAVLPPEAAAHQRAGPFRSSMV